MGRYIEYQVIGRKLPTAAEETPKLYRMRIFAPNEVVAKSRFWYYLRQLKKVKKATGEIVSVNKVKKISEKSPLRIKNFGVWLRYDSRSGTKSSVNCRVPTQYTHCTKTWQPATVPDSGRSRSCACRRSPRRRTSVVHTSSSSQNPSSGSPCLIGCSKPGASLLPTGPRLSKLVYSSVFLLAWLDGWLAGWLVQGEEDGRSRVYLLLREHVMLSYACMLCDYAKAQKWLFLICCEWGKERKGMPADIKIKQCFELSAAAVKLDLMLRTFVSDDDNDLPLLRSDPPVVTATMTTLAPTPVPASGPASDLGLDSQAPTLAPPTANSSPRHEHATLPPSEPAAPAPDPTDISVTFLLISGDRQQMHFAPTMTFGRVKEAFWGAWTPENPDTKPPSPSFLRVLHMGKVLSDDQTLASRSYVVDVYDATLTLFQTPNSPTSRHLPQAPSCQAAPHFSQ
ncbi:ribosomal l18ae/LX domain-containing protein [Rhizoctonia solani AG-1 IA]|uniref:Ribosomal l18ae/LX domain-containing protein n=1 Tax=Thanatephorus cucumeris (strain AG1-IA) TaxID=983506 RepID=L8X975_THACA|nr:ribosomal l18ae/LX domain-containing protein [Rhizoctonia solani AG-1 IA]